MALLPFHIRRLSTLRLPILYGVMLVPFIAAMAAVAWLAPERPQPPFSPRIVHVAKLLAIPPVKLAEAANLPTFVTILILGYSIGWLLNCVALMITRRLSLRAIASVIVPLEWECVNAREKLAAAKAKDQDDWLAVQKMGFGHYIVLRGGLTFGLVGFAGVNIVLPLVSLRPIAVSSLPIWLVIWILTGVTLATFTWASLKFAQRGEA